MYIGFLWDLSAKVVELPEKKKIKYLERISPWTHKSMHTMMETEIIIGTLNHICLVVPDGRSHLVPLYKFRGGFKNTLVQEVKHKLTSAAADDISWWRERLERNFVGTKIMRPPKPLDCKVFVDASSSWGIGLVINDRWLAWQFKGNWRADGREIGWAEMVAVELAVRTLIAGKFHKCHVIIRSDNQGVVGALKSGRSQGSQQNMILREIVKLIQDNNIWISCTWIPTAENLADGPSRGMFPGKSSLLSFQPKLPYHLTNFIHKPLHYHNTRLP